MISRHAGARPRRAMFTTRTPSNDVFTPPWSSSPWSDVPSKTLGNTAPRGQAAWWRRANGCCVLVVNTPPRRQAPWWEDVGPLTEIRNIALNLVPLQASWMGSRRQSRTIKLKIKACWLSDTPKPHIENARVSKLQSSPEYVVTSLDRATLKNGYGNTSTTRKRGYLP